MIVQSVSGTPSESLRYKDIVAVAMNIKVYIMKVHFQIDANKFHPYF